MRTWKTSGSALIRGFLCFALVAPAATSCYDDQALWAEIENINTKLESLEASLNGQIETLNELLAGGDITISTCLKNSDGSYDITLSDGTSFTVLSEKKVLKGMVSCKVVNGVTYWAAYNDEGELIPLKDASGNNIPVSEAKPVVEERDGVYYLMIGDVEYVTGYEDSTIITDYEVNTDDSGNICSVSFTFGDESMTFTIPMASYKGFSFILGTAAAGGKVIKNLYVSNGETYQIAARLDGVVDYVMSVPAGWDVEEVTEMNDTYLNVTAPSLSEVQSGAAVAGGALKAVAVLEDGKAMIAKLELTTVPFKTLTTTAVNAIIEKFNGVDKYLYGLVAFENYDEDALFASAAEILAANGDGVSDTDLSMPLSTMLGAEIVPGTPYVLWAIPAFYDQDGDSAGYSVREGIISKYLFGGSAVTLSVSDVTFNDAQVSFSIAGADAYYAGTVLKTETALEDVLYKVNNQIVESLTAPMEYTGSAFAFPVAEMNEGVRPASEQTYVSWVIPVNETGKYTDANIIFEEFTLNPVTAGGSTTVTAASEGVVSDRVSLSVPVSSEGASRLYYVFLTSTQAKRYQNNAEAYLLKYGTIIDAASADVKAEGLEPGTEYSLFVMSTDKDGKYGDATIASYTTSPLVYNDLEVTLDLKSLSKSTATATVTVTGGTADDYIYWVGSKNDPDWVNAEGSTVAEKVAAIQKRIVLYPEEVEKLKYTHPLENGVLSLNGLKGGTLHYIVLCAKDASGNYSLAGEASFTTLSVNLGTVVREGSTEWTNAKSQIDIKWHENAFSDASASGLFAYYSFEIKCPTDYTAYILCASDEYFSDNPNINTMNDRIIDIEMECSERTDPNKVRFDEDGEYLQEPDWVDDDGVTHVGTLMNIYDFCVHGCPMEGYVTYFASGMHQGDNCPAWENGACSNYEYAIQSIAKRRTIDYYKQHVKDTRGSYCRTQTTIDKVAQDLYEAYYPFYKDAEPLLYVNDGNYLKMAAPYASGLDEDGNVIDDVFVVLKDAQGNYYEPMKFEVPNHFEK